MWIFGYGSLVWKADFPYERKVVGYIKGYVRRFWQASIDHRGVPGNPGRVVTLVKSENSEDKVWGTAYQIEQDRIEEVIKHLDFREKGGYIRQVVIFHPCDTPLESFSLTIYTGTATNEFFIGPEEDDDIALIISKAVGDSGPNLEYLYRLYESLELFGILDPHIDSLVRKVKKILSS